MKTLLHFGLFGALLLAVTPAWSDNTAELGDYTIYYNVFGANVLDPTVAKAYGLHRGCNSGVLTVAVRNKEGNSTAANIKAEATTLIGQSNRIAMHEIRDGKALYYVGGFYLATSGDPMKFAFTVQPSDGTRSTTINLQQQFFGC